MNYKLLSKYLLFLTIYFHFTSCNFDSGSDIIIDDYEVVWIDNPNTQSLNKGEKIIDGYISAAGFDDKYIYVKQKKSEILNYFIIERTKNSFQNKPIYGPLTDEMFELKCKELDIQNPTFTKKFE